MLGNLLMEQWVMPIDHRKRRRRRRADRAPLSAWLALSEQLKGNVGSVSRQLYIEIFRHDTLPEQGASGNTEVRYVAITPWTPLSPNLIEDASWTLLPIRVQSSSEEDSNAPNPSQISFPASSLALQTFADALHRSSGAKNNGKGKKGVEIRILDVVPLKLDTIYVTVDGDALNKHEEVQKKFGGGFASSRMTGHTGKGKGKAVPYNETHGDSAKPQMQEQEAHILITAIREALALSMVVRQENLLPLPLPAHPITHVPLPPAKITLCEPVSEGLLSDDTKIIVNRTHHTNQAKRSLPSLAGHKTSWGTFVEDGEDMSKDQFFSTVEDGENRKMSRIELLESRSDSDSSEKESDRSSDDSLEDVISMNAPQLATQPSGILSSRAAATPRPGGSMDNDIKTPGSLFSNFTATTARQGSAAKGRLFKARGLSGKIPEELLHPKPGTDEDEEARVFVDVKLLLKLGCFSGDWVKLESASTSAEGNSGLWSVDAFDRNHGSDDFRPVKIYGLPDLAGPTTPCYARDSTLDRRSSMAAAPTPDSKGLVAWLSPIVLANLGQCPFVWLSPIMASPFETTAPRTPNKTSKISSSSSPPIAKEMTILRVSTPISTERALQTGIFAALKQHFEQKRRILRQGDLIALTFNVNISRLLAQTAGAPEGDHGLEELLALSLYGQDSGPRPLAVAWFKVGQIICSASDKDHTLLASDIWGGAACIEPVTTRMRQAGSECSKTPSTLNTTWERYLGIKPPVRTSGPYNPVRQSVVPVVKPYIAPLRRRLRELIAAATNPHAVHLGMDPVVVLLHSTQRNIGKATLASEAASDIGVHVFDIDAYDVLAEGGSGGDVKTEALFKARVERASTCGVEYTVILVRHLEALTADRMVTAIKDVVPDVRVLIATTTEIEKIPDGVRSIMTHELELTAPDEGEREGILRSIIEHRSIKLAHNVNLSSIALKTAALVAGNLVDIVDRARVARQDRLENLTREGSITSEASTQILIRDILVSGGEHALCVTKADFDVAVEAARKNFADAIGAPKIPNVSWDDVGGLENVKEAVMETIQLPLERPQLFAKGMKKRSGILFYGPPGTGKTLLAKAIATEFSLNFFSVKGPELLNMYIGESEANVRRVFQRARDARPCVVFFDELDSVAPKRGNQGDSGGVMDRIVSQLLAELDGMSDGDDGGGGVFVIGATNRPDLLDQALLRPGRFDKMLYLGVSDTHDKQLTIIDALTRKFAMHPDMSLRRVAGSLPFTYTGADLYALCSDAMLKAITRQASVVDAKIKALPGGPVSTAYFFDHLAADEDIAVMVTEEDFYAAQRDLVGSVR